MKRFLIAGAALALLVGSGGCSDLNEQLVSGLGSQFIGTGPGLNAAVTSAYAGLRGYYGRIQYQIMNDWGTDQYSNGDQVTNVANEIYYFTYNSVLSTSSAASTTWQNAYLEIARANSILDDGADAPVGPDLTQATKDIRMAEAHFIRALSYFELVRFFGDVTLTLHSTTQTGLSTQATRAPQDSVYQVILSDLDAAVNGLPATQSDWGRATRGAALFLRSKVYLTRAYRPWNTANKQADFQKALADIKQVIPAPLGTGTTYSLVPSYYDLWCGTPAVPVGSAATLDPNRRGYCNVLAGFNKRNSEIIFSVQFSYNTANYLSDQCGNAANICDNYLHLLYLQRYDNSNDIGVGMPRDLNNGRPFRRVRGMPYMFKVFDQTRWAGTPGQSDVMDVRFDGSFQTLWFASQANANGNSTRTGGIWASQTCPNCTSQQAVAVGDTSMFMPGYAVDNAYRQAHKFSVWVPCPQQNADPAIDCGTGSNMNTRVYDWFTAPSLKKHQDNGRINGLTDEAGGKDLIVMRLGEAYLIAAEADVQLGNLQEASDMINVLRRRAACKGPPMCSTDHTNDPNLLVTPATFTLNGNTALDFVMDERTRELAGEGQRWLDLTRPGADYFVARLKRTNPDARANVQAFHALRPIPNSQIQAVTGTPYPQNPGYF